VDVELRLPGLLVGPKNAAPAPGGKAAGALRAFSTSSSTTVDAAVQWYEPRTTLMSNDSFRSATSSLASAYYDATEQAFSIDSMVDSCCGGSPHSPLSGHNAKLLTLTEGEIAAWRAVAVAAEQVAAEQQQQQQQSVSAPLTLLAVQRASQSVVEPPVEYALRRYKQGDIVLCNAVGELLAYTKSSGVSLDDLERTLKAAEPRIDAQLPKQQQQQQQQRSGGGMGHRLSSSGGQQQQQQQHRRLLGKRWVPTTGDSLAPGVQSLPSTGLGIGGADLFSANHVVAHVRTAAEIIQKLEDSQKWKQVAFGALQMYHHHERDSNVQHFKVHCVLEESMLVSLGWGAGWQA